MKKIILVTVLFGVLLMTGCQSENDMTAYSHTNDSDLDQSEGQKNEEEHKMAEVQYQFRLETDQEKIDGVFGSSGICHIIEGFPSDYMEQTTLVYGRLKGLFGEPSYETNDFEDQYCYYITATSEDGTERLIYAYSASSGPAVGGQHDAESVEAAKQLVQYILQAEPVDYDYEGYYLDGPSKVHMWVKDGVPYVEEEALNLSDEEFGELFRQVKGL